MKRRIRPLRARCLNRPAMLVSPKVADAPSSGGWGRPGARGPGASALGPGSACAAVAGSIGAKAVGEAAVGGAVGASAPTAEVEAEVETTRLRDCRRRSAS